MEVGEPSDQDNISIVIGHGISISRPRLTERHDRNIDSFREVKVTLIPSSGYPVSSSFDYSPRLFPNTNANIT